PLWRRPSSRMTASNSPLLPSRPTANQGSQRHEGTNGNVLVVHQMLFRQRQRVHDGVSLVDGLHVKNKNHASAVAPRVPLANLAVEIELHRRPDLVWHDTHDLLAGYSLFGSQDDHHFSGFR